MINTKQKSVRNFQVAIKYPHHYDDKHLVATTTTSYSSQETVSYKLYIVILTLQESKSVVLLHLIHVHAIPRGAHLGHGIWGKNDCTR